MYIQTVFDASVDTQNSTSVATIGDFQSPPYRVRLPPLIAGQWGMADSNQNQSERVVHSTPTHFITSGGGAVLRLYRGDVSSWRPSNLQRDDGSSASAALTPGGLVGAGLADDKNQIRPCSGACAPTFPKEAPKCAPTCPRIPAHFGALLRTSRSHFP